MCRLGSCLEMAIDTFLGCLIVIRCNGQKSIGTDRCCFLCKLDTMCGIVTSRTGNNRDTAIYIFYDRTDRSKMFFIRHCSRLTCCGSH